MPRVPRAALLALVSLSTVAIDSARAQQFGRNKVEYVDFDFKIFDTEHFSVYHYASEEESARIVARLAERWYARLSRVLEHELSSRQPLILYGSQPEFAQTNVVGGFLNEGIGGVTESARRRIVMPFAPTLAETDRILGHEIAHAFQFDITRKSRGALTWPLWAVEGMAQYLALGADDAETSMWLRDAVRSDLLPRREQEAARKFSPYRYGHAMWAYLAGRFGDRLMADVLKDGRSSGLNQRLRNVTGFQLQQLFDDWRALASRHYGPASTPASGAAAMLRERESGRLYLGPSLSPEGRRAVFFSERDRLSLDLFLADTSTGEVIGKLASTAASARFESLQAIRSSGSWSPDGTRFMFAAIERGQPTLVIVDMTRLKIDRQVKLDQFGQVLTPSWSPDGERVVFAALDGGLTDLFTYELASGRLNQLTRDAYSDLHPAWSPDGRQIAFVTDRFSTNLSALTFGPRQLAILDVGSGAVRPVEALDGAPCSTPQWSPDGASLFLAAAPDGIANVYRIDVASGLLARVTNVPGGVVGLTPSSPVLSVARDATAMAFTAFRNGKYAMDMLVGASALAGERFDRDTAPAVSTTLPPTERVDFLVQDVLDDAKSGLPADDGTRARQYRPNLFLEALGPPYISSGGGPFGTFVRGGGSLLFSDLLGERKIAAYAQVGNRLRDLALGVRFLNREHRWNWGASAEVQPSIRRLPRSRLTDLDGHPAVTYETQYFERTQVRAVGHLAYPLNHAQRVEFEAGARHIDYRSSVHSTARSLETGRVLGQTTEDAFGGEPITVAEAGAAFVHDTAIFGPTSPILGGRSRIDVTSTFGELSITRLLLDHRVYLMPIKPYTIAGRIVHLGQYGRDARDPRLVPTFLGSRQFVRGYGWNSLHCRADVSGECNAYDDLLANRFIVANVEVRAPVMGMLRRELRYGPVPAEAFIFADSGYVWAQSPAFTIDRPSRRLISSFGIGARLNAFGVPLEIAAVRALSAPARGWSFDFSFTPGF